MTTPAPPAAWSDDPLQAFQLSARTIGRAVDPGRAVARVVVLDADGRRIIDLAVPPGPVLPVALPAAAEQAPPDGWDFSTGTARYDGRRVDVTGRKLALLKVLAEAPGPVPTDDLRAAWQGYDVSDSGIRWQVVELRKALRRAFPDFEGDPVPASGTGYQLAIR